MQTKDYLSYIVGVIHTTIVAAVDDEGLPATAAIDMMDNDENSLYFLTAKGKGFYDRLKKLIWWKSSRLILMNIKSCRHRTIRTESSAFFVRL